MKITIDRRVFAQALSEVTPFAPVKAPIAILKNAKITTKGNRMKIEANDTQCSMVKYIETLECDQDGSFLMDMSEVCKFFQKVKGDSIEINVANNSIKVKHTNGVAEFQTQDAKDFPAFNMPEECATEISLSPSILADAISKGRGFVSTDTIRPQMCSIYAYIKDGLFGFCATDTTKLAHGYTPINNDSDIFWFITPSVFSALTNACKNAEDVTIKITDKRAMYHIGNTVIQTTMPNGKFPDFKRVIPQTWAMECCVDKDALMDALSRVQLLCDQSQCVKFDITYLDMSVSVDNMDYMKSAQENLTHAGCGGNIKIGMNVGNVITSLNVLGSGNILMRMENSSRPMIFTRQDNESFQVVCMPMSII